MKTVCVLISTYNGEKFLREQLDSVLMQEGVNLHVLARDDGSVDDTVKILDEYAEKDSRFKYYVGENKKPAYSFLDLIQNAPQADYYAFCDQDDIWDKDKLYAAISLLAKEDPTLPVLYYSNLRIVDENNVFIRMAHSVPHIAKNKYSFLMETLPTGCTMVFNLTLVRMAYKNIPKKCAMHDSWIYMIASVFGKCVYDFTPYINYRQHSTNVIGTNRKKCSISSLKRNINYIFYNDSEPRYINASSFYEIYKNQLDDGMRKKFDIFLKYKINTKNLFICLFDNELTSRSIYRTLRFKMMLLLKKA